MEGATLVALLAIQQIAITGTTPTYAAVTASDTCLPDDGVFLHVKNTTGTADNATVVVPGSYLGQAVPDVVVNVPITTGDKMIGPLTQALADPTTGLVTITHSFVNAGVTCALIRLS
jgi:hypothetical protein